MQHGQEDHSFHRKLEPPLGQQFAKNLRKAQLVPEPPKDQGRADLDRRRGLRLTLSVGVQHGRVLGKPSARSNQGINLAALLKNIETTQRRHHALAHFAVDALVMGQLKIPVRSALLGSNKHGKLRGASISTTKNTRSYTLVKKKNT